MVSDTKSTPLFGDACKKFVKAGIPRKALLPVAPVDARIAPTGDLSEKVLGKAPGRYSARKDDWRGLGGTYINSGVPDKDADAFASWPTPNVGMLGRFCPAIDSDAGSDEARRFIERVLTDVYGADAGIAERLRGKGPRRLYAFRHAKVGKDLTRLVRPRHITYRMPGEGKDSPPHKLDIIGTGAQYLIAGRHQSGDDYEWHPDFDLANLFEDGQLLEIEAEDITRFLEAFEAELEKIGGSISRSTGGRAPGQERDYSKEKPIMPPPSLLAGLRALPNNRDNFETHDDFVSALAMIIAAFGSEAAMHRDDIAEWACEDPDLCSQDYFDKTWASLQNGVRVDRNSLDRVFKRAGVFESARAEFPDDAKEATKGIRAQKTEKREKAFETLAKVAQHYIFGRVNTRNDNGSLKMRAAYSPAIEWRAEDWWNYEIDDEDALAVAHELQGHERYPANKKGMWNFVRDLNKQHPEVFYTGETLHPNFDRGEMIEEVEPNGNKLFEVNMRFLSPVIRAAQRLEKSITPEQLRQGREDADRVVEFIGRVFGDHARFELDTLAYMAQTGRRPGHMLFLVGEMGVGKSIYANMLVSMFDGIGRDVGGQIDGTKLTSEAARRFALARVEGCRIINVKELPEGTNSTNMVAITSSLKQIVDPGPDGEFFLIEKKGQDSKMVRNFARIITTSNYKNSLAVEENDRRIFYVNCGIDMENKPVPQYYSDLIEVTTNPERLAGFYRWLLARDVAHYDVAKAPPVSSEKREAIVASMTNPWERHMLAAIELLKHSGRSLFSSRELESLMTAMSDNEFSNTNGEVDDRRKYDFGTKPMLLKRLGRYAEKIGRPRIEGVRCGTLYRIKPHQGQHDHVLDMSDLSQLEALKLDQERHPLTRAHPFQIYVGPTTPREGQR